MLRPGDPALLRHVLRGRVGWALPCLVVEDTDERLALLRQPGTASKSPPPTEDLWQRIASGAFDVVDSRWRLTYAVEIAPWGRAHSVWPMWDESWTFLGWYVNLQEPFRRSRFGVDSFDHALDITVSPSLKWRWKDEDQHELLVELGILTPAQRDAGRHEGEGVIADIEAGRRPFDEPWPSWRPPPSWSIPTLPDGWDVLG